MARRRRPLPAGEIEHLNRPFDQTADVAHLAAPRFNSLKTGEWGVRWFQTTGNGRPVFVDLRISDDVQSKGQRVPFANQLEDIAKAIAAKASRREVAAVFWDCESASDYRGSGRGRRTIVRQGFEACLAAAASLDRPCAEVWVWRSDRLARGYRYLPQLMALEDNRVALMSATGRLQRDFLPLEIMMAKRERDTFRLRGQTGKRSLAVRYGRPPTRRIPVGWVIRWRSPDPTDKTYDILHDPAGMPAWEAALTGLRFGGWTWERATDHLNACGVKRHADRDQTADARALAWNPRLVRKSLRNHTWWTGAGRWTSPTMELDEEGEEVAGAPEVTVFAVPPAMVDEPGVGRRPLTADDLAVIFTTTTRGAGGGWRTEGAGKRPLMERARCAVCGRGLRHQLVRSATGDYYLLRCDSPSLARENGRERCPRRPVMLREAQALEDIWGALSTLLLEPAHVRDGLRRELSTLEARPALRDAARLREHLEQLLRTEAGLLVARASEPGNEAAYEVALGGVRRDRQGVQEALMALEEEAVALTTQEQELRRSVVAMEAYAAALDGQDARARAAWEEAFRRASEDERGALIAEVVEAAAVDGGGVWRVRVGLAGAGAAFRLLVPDGMSSRTLSTWYKSAPALTLTVGRTAA